MSLKRALITGVAGQDGRYLTDLLLEKDYEVFGMVGPDAGDLSEWAAGRGATLHLIEGDMTSSESLQSAVAASSPDEVYNFAGLSSVGSSWQQAALVAEVNAVGVVRLLDALHSARPDARFCQASSADIFGLPRQSPQDESTEISPVSPYGASKAYAHFMTRSYRNIQKMFACNAIFFNHESPLRPPSFVVRKITQSAARIHAGLQDELRLGNLDVFRDWGFAGDYVRGMWLALQAAEPDDYVIASGVSHTVRDVCEVAFKRLGLDYREYVVVDSQFFRPIEAVAQAGDASKARRVLGWEPSMGFEQVVSMMVDHDVELLAGISKP